MRSKDITFFVYVDYTVENRTAFYVGKGTATRVSNTKRNKKHQNVSAKYGCDRLVVIATTDEAEAFEYEILLTEKLRTFCSKTNINELACNFTLGGEGCYGGTWKLSEETRRRQSIAKTGVRLPAEAIARMAETKRGRKHTPEHCRKISEGNKGKVVPESVRIRISQKLMGHKVSDASRQKMSESIKAAFRGKENAFKGHKHTNESKKKISDAGKRRVVSDATREKLRQNMLARYKDPEFLSKTADRMQKAWETRRAKAGKK